jgi:hypothetical protein
MALGGGAVQMIYSIRAPHGELMTTLLIPPISITATLSRKKIQQRARQHFTTIAVSHRLSDRRPNYESSPSRSARRNALT